MIARAKCGVRMRVHAPILALACFFFAAPLAAQVASCPVYLPEVETGTIKDSPPLLEISGISPSRQSPGVLWIHNDGGNPNHIYAINEAGKTLATFALSGATNQDWEDIAIGPGPVSGQDYLYIGDIGNNSLSRSSVVVYRVAEPFVDPNKAPETAGTNVITLNGVAALPMTYPSGRFNAAALMVDPLTTDIYVVKKELVNNRAEIYVRPAPQTAGVSKSLQFVTSVPSVDPVTAADISPAGDQILLRRKDFSHIVDIFLWPWAPNQTFAQAVAPAACPVPAAFEPVGTAIGFAHDGNGYYSLSEGWHKPVYFYERVTENAPMVTITQPADGAVVQAGASVSFAATATDEDDGDVGASLAWTSSLDGPIASGPSFVTSSLSAGTHTITATASNSIGEEGSDEIALIVNAQPAVSIASPTDGTTVAAGVPIDFAASVIDEDANLASNLSWISSEDGAIGSGASFAAALSAAGTHLITASVTDSRGATGSAQISVNVFANATPTVVISAPQAGAVVNVGTSVAFAATASDPDEGDVSASLAWTSSIDGAIGSGASFSTSALSVGTHMIVATASDQHGAEGSDQRTLVVNGPPVVSISSPANGALAAQGTTVSFAGSASDEDGNLSAGLGWTSNLNGNIGSGASFSTSALSVGVHTITASVTDSRGLTGSKSISLSVVENKPPVVTITAPANGSVVNAGSNVSFAATAADPEEGNVASSLVWSSSLDGSIGSGAGFSTSGLSAGTHVITATAADSLGASGSAQITLVVNAAPTVAITAPADGTRVNRGSPLTLSGTATDPEDGVISAGIVWTSSKNGALGTGANVAVNTSGLGKGKHAITARITDSRGATRETSISIFVR